MDYGLIGLLLSAGTSVTVIAIAGTTIKNKVVVLEKTLEKMNNHTPPCKEMLIFSGKTETSIEVIKTEIKFIGDYIRNGKEK